MKHRKCMFIPIAVVAILCGRLAGQVTPGLRSFSGVDQHEIDTIDLSSNNIILSVPITAKPGSLPFSATLTANSFMSVNAGGSWLPNMQPVPGLNGSPFYYGINAFSLGGVVTVGPAGSVNTTCGGAPTVDYINWFVQDSMGTVHWLPTSDYTTSTSGSGCQPTFTDQASDGSGFTISASGPNAVRVYSRDGTVITHLALTDAHGNTISAEGSGSSLVFTDSMGLSALTMENYSSTAAPQYSWTDVNGGAPTVAQQYSSLVTQTNFGCSNVADITDPSANLTTGFSFPDGTSLGLTYESTPNHTGHYTGRIYQITLRGGGVVKYTYGGGTNNGIDCHYQTVPVLTRTLGNGDTTTYTLSHPRIAGTANYQALNKVIDPGGNETDYTFTGFTASGISSASAQVLTEGQRFQGNGTGAMLLENDIYCYNTAFSSCSTATAPTASVAFPITKKVVFHQIGGVGGMTNYSATETHFDAYGNVTYSAQYDFGGTSPIRATTIIYYQAGTSCGALSSGSTINDRPCEVSTTQGSSTVADTKYTYDVHGNLATVSRWNGTAWIGQSAANTYNTNGTPIKTYDLANNETDYTYSSSGYPDCTTSCTQFPFPTQIKNLGTGIHKDATWYGVGGAIKTFSDPNGNTTTYTYTSLPAGAAEPYWRVLTTTDPVGLAVNNTFPNGPGASFLSTTTAQFNSNNSFIGSINSFDGYGRLIDTQVEQAPVVPYAYDTISRAYSNGGFTVQVSEPCSLTVWQGSCPSLSHTINYDALGRVSTTSTTSNETLQHTYTKQDDFSELKPAPVGENTKQMQTEYDGLGRVSKVCQIGNGVMTACGQATGSKNGVTTAFSYTQASGSTMVSATLGSQTRSTTYDAMGRTASKIIPESGSTPFNFYYDSHTGCASSSGNLVCAADPNGNLLKYTYDSLNRVTQVNANGTTCRHFYYDATYGTVPSGVTTPVNTLGRIAEASTDNCAGSLITDEWFSYDAAGRVSDMWEKTPHSGQYYHSTATFFEDGTMKTLQLASPSLYTMTYTLDGEGRWNSLTDTTATQNIVTDATFYPASNPAVVSLTASDNDAYTIDTNTGNVSKFVFTLASSNMTGKLTWNQNRSLGSLQIVDGFNAGGNQTCGSVYDDTERLISFDCGSGGWGQNYSYGNYDNLTKTVISGRSGSTWNPGYNTANNHYNCGAACTNDTNGNVTGDGNNTFQWNEFSKMKSTATSGTPTCGSSGNCTVYDAFGRIVETSSGSTWKERWITQLGETANMAGSTINYAYFPGPEGGTTIVNGNSSSFGYMHPDWVGSARVVSSITGHGATVDQAFTPYGEMYDSFGSTSSQYDMFATLTSNFDNGVTWDTPNRELSIVGRWLSPDPANVGWNQYAYPTNPNSFNDPTGLFLKCAVDANTGGPLGQNCSTVGDPYFSNGDDSGFGSGAGGFSFDFNFGTPCSDFMPCGLALPGLGESLWSDVLGLPSGLNCPQVGGVSDYLCGGVSPAMDAENNSRPCTAADYEKDADAQANMIYHAQDTFVNTYFTKWLAGSSMPIILGCLKGGPLGCLVGTDIAILGQPAIIPGAMIWGSYAAYKEALTNPTNYKPLNCRS